MRAAIYARMSTDKQSPDSPADQVTRCREFAAKHDLQVMEALIVTDAGISGASRHNRPALLELMARIDEWDVLLCWDSSRLARDSEDLGWIRNRLRAHRRTGYEVSTGLDLFNVGAKVLGVMAEEYLVKLRADTQRGLRGRAERGLSTGGTPYGYRSEPVALDEHGRPVEGAGFRIVIDETEAAVVRRICELYLGGAGLREIAHRLNADGVTPPRPRALKGRPPSWAPTAIREMLRNPIYRGERIFNRSEWVKDHETGRRRRFERPAQEWMREERPDLALVARETFEAVQAETQRRAAGLLFQPGKRGLAGALPGKGGRGPARHMLSGFLECGVCGGGFHALNSAGRYGCGWHYNRGRLVCPSDLAVPRTALEERIFGAMRERILVPEFVAYTLDQAIGLAADELQDEPREIASEQAARLAEVEDDLATLRRVAARTGRAGQVAQLVGELEAERTRRTKAGPPPGRGAIDFEAWRPELERWLYDVRTALEGAPEERRDGLPRAAPRSAHTRLSGRRAALPRRGALRSSARSGRRPEPRGLRASAPSGSGGGI